MRVYILSLLPSQFRYSVGLVHITQVAKTANISKNSLSKSILQKICINCLGRIN